MPSIYDNPVTRAYKESDARRATEAKRLAPLREKHATEKAKLQAEHHAASAQLNHEQQVDRDRVEQYPSKPSGFDAEQKKARAELLKKHEGEREKLKSKHASELSAAKKRA